MHSDELRRKYPDACRIAPTYTPLLTEGITPEQIETQKEQWLAKLQADFDRGLIKQSAPDARLERVLLYLNSLLATDRSAITALMQNRIPCNEALAGHPHVIVGDQDGYLTVGTLGVLNGLLAAIGLDRVAGIISDDGHGLLTGFKAFESGALRSPVA